MRSTRAKRTTLELGDDLIRQIKAICALDGRVMSEAIREELEKAFGPRRVKRPAPHAAKKGNRVSSNVAETA